MAGRKRKRASISKKNIAEVGSFIGSKVDVKNEISMAKKQKTADRSTEGMLRTKNKPCSEKSSSPKTKQEKLCSACKNLLPRGSFSNSQLKRPTKKSKCRTCVSAEKSMSKKHPNFQELKSPEEQKKAENEGAVKSNSDNDLPDDKKKSKNGVEKKKKSNVEERPEVVKARLIDRARIMPSGQSRNTFQLSWNDTPVPELDEKQMAEKLIEKGYWGVLDEERKANIVSFIESSSSSMTLLQALSLRRILLQQKAMFRHQVMQEKSKRLYKDYKDGKTVVELSKAVDCPPLNVFRMILAKMNYSKAKIKKSVKEPQKFLGKREQKELKHALSMDIVSTFDQNQLAEYADAFEDAIAAFLNSKGIAFVRQNQLQEEQTKEFGKNILTPDFLFLDTVTINGKKVTWIDAKAFYGADIPFNVKKMKRQLSRYIDHWGEGAVVYLQGFSETLSMNRCSFLNADGVLKTDKLDHKVWD